MKNSDRIAPDRIGRAVHRTFCTQDFAGIFMLSTDRSFTHERASDRSVGDMRITNKHRASTGISITFHSESTNEILALIDRSSLIHYNNTIIF